MNKNTLFEMISELRKTNSTLEKQKILKKYKNDEIVKKVLFYTYNSLFQYFVKKYDKIEKEVENFDLLEEFNKIFNVLDILRKREMTGHKAINLVEETYKNLSKENKEIFSLILKRDLKAGINKKLINKIFKDLIPTIPYMGARAFDKKGVTELFANSKEVWGEIKYDGMFLNLIKENGEIKTLSRAGKDLGLENIFKNGINEVDNVVITGELLVQGFNRYISNGLIKSYSTILMKIKEAGENNYLQNKKIMKDIEKFNERYKTDFNKIHEKIYVVAWDMIPFSDWTKGKSKIILKDRRANLEKYFPNEKIKLSEYVIIKDYNESIKEFRKQKDNGEEGIILKDVYSIYEDGKKKSAWKFKIIMDVDLRIKKLIFGNKGTKYENVINRIMCESEDGIVKVQTSALTEDEMDYVTKHKDSLIDKIVTVRSSGISEDKNGGISLLHPRFIEIRDDKTEADNYEQIKKIEKMVTELNDNEN